MSTTITFRSWTDPAVAPPAAGDAVFLLRTVYDAPAGGTRAITIEGRSFGSATVSVRVTVGTAATVSANGAVGAGGAFSVQLQVPAGGATDSVVVVGANSAAGCTGTDRVLFLFRDAGVLALQSGPLAAVAASRLGYAAGAPDRLQFSRTFVRLQPGYGPLRLAGDLAIGNEKLGYRPIKAADFNGGMEQVGTQFWKDVKAGKVKADTYEAHMHGTAVEVLVRSLENARPDGLLALVPRTAVAKKSAAKKKAAPKKAAAQAAPRTFADTIAYLRMDDAVLGRKDRIRTAVDEMVEQMKAWAKAHQRLGILFHERLRARPTNEVFGEPFYQLALTPGEEVQVRQTTETKRRTAFTEIDDRESERTNSFSSNWSTDFASAISSENSFQMGTNIGGGIQASVPDVPVGVSGQAGANTNEAHTVSGQETAQQHRTQTESVTARMRQQHRTQVELTVEDTQSFGSTRTLRNHDQQRTQMHTFFKVYRKEQMTLERFDARLCFRFVVNDPACATRGAFLAGLNKIDPEVLAYRNVPKPPDHVLTEFDIMFNAPDTPIPAVHLWREDRLLYERHGLYARSDINPERYDIADMPRWTMTECEIFTPDGLVPIGGPDGSDPSHVGSARRSYIEHVEEAWAFRRNGGTIQWERMPDPVRDRDVWEWVINMPRNFEGPQLGDNRTSEIVRIKFNVQCRWKLSAAGLSEYLAKVEAERLRLSADLTAQQVYDLHAIAEKDYPSAVTDLALSQGLTFDPNNELYRIKELFDLDQVTIDNIPYWADAAMKRQHEQLAARLERLPVSIEQHRVLTDALLASQAVVYVPVKKGAEREALLLLKEARHFSDQIANDVQQFRDARYGRFAPFVAPAIDVHLGPAPTTATPAGSAQWATEWEKPQQKFDILGQWSELLPTDGVHVETQLSTTVVTDEQETDRLRRIQSTGA